MANMPVAISSSCRPSWFAGCCCIPWKLPVYGSKSKGTMCYVPRADNKPKVSLEISESVIFRFLLNEETMQRFDEAEIPEMLAILKDIDKQSKITQVEIYRSSMGLWKDLINADHNFIVFITTSEKEGDHCWSLEKDLEHIVLQRSRMKEDVKNKKNGVLRNGVQPIKEDLTGKGTIQDLFALLWVQQIIQEKYHIKKSNCQTLVTFVSKQITEIGYEFEGFFPYSPPPKNDDQYAKIILVLIKLAVLKTHPLFASIYLESTDLLDTMIALGKYDVDGTYSGFTLLHYAIVFSKTTMVRHLLEKKKVDPRKRDQEGIGALHLAAFYAETTEIIDIILKTRQCNINRVDNDGNTPLHYAIIGFNPTAENVRYLIEKGADPNVANKKGVTPMDVAVTEEKKELVDIMEETSKYGVVLTPLHLAARNVVDDTYGNKRGSIILAYARELPHEISEKLSSVLKKYGTKEWYEDILFSI